MEGCMKNWYGPRNSCKRQRGDRVSTEGGPAGLASKMPGQKRDSEQLELRQRLCPPVLTGVDWFVPQNLGWKSRISPYSVF